MSKEIDESYIEMQAIESIQSILRIILLDLIKKYGKTAVRKAMAFLHKMPAKDMPRKKHKTKLKMLKRI